MNTKTLSSRATSIIDQYLNFRVGNPVCSIPYFNNKTVKARGSFRAYGGKGSPKDIFDEIQSIVLKAHIDLNLVSNESLKKLLTDNNLGIDCSGFAYYILNAESEDRGKGKIDKHISFVNCHSLIAKIRCSLRPIENCDVSTFAHDKNSKIIPLTEIQPGDIITMLESGGNESRNEGQTFTKPFANPTNERDHILVVHQVEYQNFVPYKIHYSHAVAYPEDGVYGSGIKQGTIEILDTSKPITDARWTENEKQDDSNRIFVRAKKSKTELRRLKWL